MERSKYGVPQLWNSKTAVRDICYSLDSDEKLIYIVGQAVNCQSIIVIETKNKLNFVLKYIDNVFQLFLFILLYLTFLWLIVLMNQFTHIWNVLRIGIRAQSYFRIPYELGRKDKEPRGLRPGNIQNHKIKRISALNQLHQMTQRPRVCLSCRSTTYMLLT